MILVVLTCEASAAVLHAVTDSDREDIISLLDKVIIVCARLWRVNVLGENNNAGDDTRVFIGSTHCI